MYSRTHRVLCWFTVLEQVLENMVRPVQHALEKYIVSVIKQFTDSWCVLVTITDVTDTDVVVMQFQLSTGSLSANQTLRDLRMSSVMYANTPTYRFHSRHIR